MYHVVPFQDLLASRKAKLKITEEILVEKGDQKKHLDKDVEKMKRRESYVEKELIDRNVDIKLDKSNMYCFDSEAFRFLYATLY